MSSLVRLQASAAEPSVRLLCFPHAGSGAALFHPWRNAFPSEVEVFAVRLPGRESRYAEPLQSRFGAVVGDVLADLAALDDRPLALLGHCLGALLAFEVARELRRRAHPEPCWLFVSSQAAPQTLADESEADRLSHLASPDLWARVRLLGGTDPELLDSPDLMELVAPILRADFRLAESYVYEPEPPLAAPIVAFGNRRDPIVRADALRGWSAETSATFRVDLADEDGHFPSVERWQAVRHAVAERLVESEPARYAPGA